jgi:SAM-dependent methyltransferase
MFSNEDQQKIWNEEHKNPQVLLQMDAQKPSSGVIKFFEEFLQKKDITKTEGLEMACGKGRSVIFLAQQGITMHGFDFSPHAIDVAKERSKGKGNTSFTVVDATQSWPFEDDQFDFVIDCFGSTDIVSKEGRQFAYQEIHRVLKPGGLVLMYLLSPDDSFHQTMIAQEKAKSDELGAFHHPENNKFEKVFTEKEIEGLLGGFDVVKKERIVKKAFFHGQEYQCKHWWVVAKK